MTYLVKYPLTGIEVISVAEIKINFSSVKVLFTDKAVKCFITNTFSKEH